MEKSMVEQIAEAMQYGPADIGYDDVGYYDDGSVAEGPWYIVCGGESWCYFPTKEEAQAVIDLACEVSRRTKNEDF